MTSPPTPPTPIRLTITVSPEVHATFKRMAQISSSSIGRSMGEWLADTLDAAQFVTDRLERAREAPRQVAREMRQALLGALDETDAVIAAMRPHRHGAAGAGGSAAPAGAAGGSDPSPRPVIRGVKSRPGTGKGG